MLTSPNTFFEDFEPGLVIRHTRGKTVEALENVLFTNMVLNTGEGHFNEHAMRDTPLGGRLVFGGVTAALVVGMAGQDTGENVIRELSMTGLRLQHPVMHGDTLYAFSEVLETRDSDRPDAGIVVFRHWGVNQDDRIVCQCERTALVRRREIRPAQGDGVRERE